MAITSTYVAGKQTGKGLLTKGADSDVTVNFTHGLGGIPDEVVLTAVSGIEDHWRVRRLTTTSIFIECSQTVGTVGSQCLVLARRSHSLIL